jgi:hypothetical protein
MRATATVAKTRSMSAAAVFSDSQCAHGEASSLARLAAVLRLARDLLGAADTLRQWRGQT